MEFWHGEFGVMTIAEVLNSQYPWYQDIQSKLQCLDFRKTTAHSLNQRDRREATPGVPDSQNSGRLSEHITPLQIKSPFISSREACVDLFVGSHLPHGVRGRRNSFKLAFQALHLFIGRIGPSPFNNKNQPLDHRYTWPESWHDPATSLDLQMLHLYQYGVRGRDDVEKCAGARFPQQA